MNATWLAGIGLGMAGYAIINYFIDPQRKVERTLYDWDKRYWVYILRESLKEETISYENLPETLPGMS